MSTYNVYKVQYRLAVQDPDMPGKRYHTVIFVETNADGAGYIHHVTGDLVTGMQYQTKVGRRPEDSATYHNKQLIGKIAASSYPENVNSICRTLTPPPKQKAFNTKTMKTEPIKADGTFYEPGETRKPLIKCTEWTENQAIPALETSGILS